MPTEALLAFGMLKLTSLMFAFCSQDCRSARWDGGLLDCKAKQSTPVNASDLSNESKSPLTAI